MVKHIVLWKIKDSFDKQQNIDRMIEMLNGLVGKIDGLVSIEMGHNFNTSSDYDVVLYATLKNTSALRYYQNHPEHVKCKDFISQITDGRVAADYFYEDEIVTARPVAEVPDAPDMPEETAAPKKTIPEITIEMPPKRTAETPAAPAISVEKPAPYSAPVTPTAPEISVEAPAPYSAPAAPAAPAAQAPFAAPTKPADQVPPDSWKCPACGQIVPDFLFTCDCGEPKPYDTDAPAPAPEPISAFNTPPAPQPAPKPAPNFNTPPLPKFNDHPVRKPVDSKPTDTKPKFSASNATPDHAQVNPVNNENQTFKETKSVFGKKKIDVDVTPLEQRSDTWTCPACGKIMPKYVGTCGCGEPQPFEFDSDEPAPNEPLPEIRKPAPRKKMTQEEISGFDNVQPPISGYNAQINRSQNNTGNTTDNNSGFGSSFGNSTADQQNNAYDFSNVPPAAPMRFNNAPPASMVGSFSQPMKNNQTASSFNSGNDFNSSFNNEEAKPMRFNDLDISNLRQTNTPVDDFSTAKKNGKKEKRAFGKKAKEAEVFRQAQEAVNNRKDVPNDGTWTCPSCGKVMPKYVGTCGCGESQPFEF